MYADPHRDVTSYEILEVKNETSREKFESCEDYWKSVSFETVR